MDISKLIGKSYKTVSQEIIEEDVVFFSKTTKQEDEIFFNKKVALKKGFPQIVCPPTFLISIGMKKNILAEFLKDLRVGIENILHAGQEFNFKELVFAGDTIFMKTILKNTYKKNEGKIEFCVFESKYFNQNRVEVCLINNTLLIKN